MYIEEVSPDTPRFALEYLTVKQEIDVRMRKENPERYKENGVPYSKKEAKELNLPKYKFSKNTIKLKKLVKTMCALMARKRKKNNEKTTKTIFELGNEFYIEKNNHKAWGMKRCRMNEIANKKYDNGIRRGDYTKQSQDRAVGQIPARLKGLCQQKKLSYNEINGINLSTYNHFTKQNDIFLKLNDRILTLNEKCVNNFDDEDKNKIIPFKESISTINRNGKRYILQRNLYAASKMLYCYKVEEKEKRINKKGEEYMATVEKWYFDQEGYEEFFDKIFYPNQEKYLKQLEIQKRFGVEINETILE